MSRRTSGKRTPGSPVRLKFSIKTMLEAVQLRHEGLHWHQVAHKLKVACHADTFRSRMLTAARNGIIPPLPEGSGRQRVNNALATVPPPPPPPQGPRGEEALIQIVDDITRSVCPAALQQVQAARPTLSD